MTHFHNLFPYNKRKKKPQTNTKINHKKGGGKKSTHKLPPKKSKEEAEEKDSFIYPHIQELYCWGQMDRKVVTKSTTNPHYKKKKSIYIFNQTKYLEMPEIT